jgi:hypothetical protein
MEFITFTMYLLLKRSPLLLLLVGGTGFAIFRWKRHPRVSLMTALALLTCLVETMFFSILYLWFPRYLISLGLSGQMIDTIESALLVTDDFVFAVVLILLVAAAFTGRDLQTFTINQRT